ncbi:thymic stromal lymphopoietin [Erinaceus europaeus]|uniref:Thymic stromal lymphopoietin n=1 Tax=Erinaceus europaeus TaxID=9365 RepID=A0A1S3AAI6_ERIEU|nr:thymic stromal lymphopoietin [Erinaceus europaeus]
MEESLEPSTWLDALLFVLPVFFRKIFLLQLVGLVLTYDFNSCDFASIKMDYLRTISKELEKCVDEDTSAELDSHLECEEKVSRSSSAVYFLRRDSKGIQGKKMLRCIETQPSECLTEIELLTFNSKDGCPSSLAKSTFAKKIKASFTLHCPDYPGIQINNNWTVKKKNRRKREDKICECPALVSVLKELWYRFSRLTKPPSKS